MGRVIRWLKTLLTGRKEGHGGLKVKENHIASDGTEKSFEKHRESGVDGGKRPSDTVAVAAAAGSSQVRPCRCGGLDGVRSRKEMAAVVIQKSLRGYLARKALRALRSLVKLQALVRGYLVRKQAATTLRRLQALMRLQADSYAVKRASHRRSTEQVRIVTRDPRMKPPATPDHCRRLSNSTDSNYERSPRVVEMDTCHLHSRSTRTMSSRYTADDLSGCLAPSCSLLSNKQHPTRLSSTRQCHERDPRHAKTTQNTPRFLWPTPPHGSPSKSVNGSLTSRPLSHRDALLSTRYMSGTASSTARIRCQSSHRRAEAPSASLTRAAPRMSCTQVQGNPCFHYPGTARMGSSDISDESARDYYLDRMW